MYPTPIRELKSLLPKYNLWGHSYCMDMGPDCFVTLPSGFRYTIDAIFYSIFFSFQSSYAQNSTNRNYRLVKLIYELCARKHSITISYQTLHHTSLSQTSNSESTHIVEARRNWLCHGTHGVKHVSVKFVVGIQERYKEPVLSLVK